MLVWIALCSSINSSAKAILLNEDAGINNIEITAIGKDKGGLMWIGTKRGLNRYDGYRFVSIPFFVKRTIQAMVYDSARNVMWLGTDVGLYYIHCNNNEVVQCTSVSKRHSVTCLLIKNQQIIVGFQHTNILQINPDLSCRVLYHFSSKQLLGNKMINDVTGNIFVALHPGNTLVKIENKNNKVTTVAERFYRQMDVLTVFEGEVHTGGFDIGFWNIERNRPSKWYADSLNAIRQDPECVLSNNQSILIAYRNPTRVIEVRTGDRKIVNRSASDMNVFSNKRIYCLYRDDIGVIWVGTSKGLIKLIPDKPMPVFEKLLCYPNNPVSTRQIVEDNNGDLYVASYAGLYRFDKRKQRWKNKSSIYYKGRERPFSQRSLLNAGSQYIYIGSDAHYFIKLNKYTQRVETVFAQSADELCDTDGASLSLVQDGNGIIWIGSDKGLISFDTLHSTITCHFKDKYALDGSTVKYLYMLPDRKQFWAGTEMGLYLVDVTKGVLRHFDQNTTPALTGNYINAVTTDVAGNVWIATDDAGINVLSADFREVYAITKKDGLSSNEVYHFLWQDSLRIWISTYNGLNYYHTQTKTITPYFESDGITHNEFNQNSAFKGADGKLYFGGINGITAFIPTQMESYQQPFGLFVSGISKWEKSSETVKQVFVENGEWITVKPGDNQLTFTFAGTDYTHPELNTYFYKIEGLHRDWISLGTQPSLRLESLKGGEYTLLIKAIKGSRGVASINTLTYLLDIKQVFYQTIWFYLLLASGLALFIYFYFSNRLKTQQKLELLRVKIASNLHDEVGSILTRITMSADRLVTRMPSESETKEKLEGVSELSRAANMAMSDVLWTIDARNDVAGSLTDRMREHAEDLLLPRGIDMTVDFTEIDQLQRVSPEFRQHLFLLYKEVINNIIKHSNAVSVSIYYKQSGEHCVLHVKNDGVHESLGTVSTGQGLRNIKMRAELLKGTAEIARLNDCFEVKVII
ncbi:MAG: two-component regulator propeller domain-containing protein [Bacteroidota bacterium]